MPMMQPHLQPLPHQADDRKPTTQQNSLTSVPPQSQELSASYTSHEEQLRRTMSRCPVVWQGT